MKNSAPVAANANTANANTANPDFNFNINRIKNNFYKMGDVNTVRKTLNRRLSTSTVLTRREKLVIDVINQYGPVTATEIANILNSTASFAPGAQMKNQQRVDKNNIINAAGKIEKSFTNSEIYKILSNTDVGFALVLAGRVAMTVNTSRIPNVLTEAAIYSILNLSSKSKKDHVWPIDHEVVTRAAKVLVKKPNTPDFGANGAHPDFDKEAKKKGYNLKDFYAAVATGRHVIGPTNLKTLVTIWHKTVTNLLKATDSVEIAKARVLSLEADINTLTQQAAE